MRSPVIYSTTGAVLSSDEIAFAHNVAASFSHQTKPDYVKIVRRVDPVTGAAVDYHLVSNIAYVTPGGAVDYVAVQLSNPVPYRGISIGVVSPTHTWSNFVYPDSVTYVTTSDAVILAQESVVDANPDVVRFIPGYRTNGFDTFVVAYPWSGGGSVWMFDHGALAALHHKMAFVVPEDCVYPGPSPTPPVYNAVDGRDAEWAADWASGVAEFDLRRDTWFRRSSDETIAALKSGFAAGSVGVTHASLKRGGLPIAGDTPWDLTIKLAVDDHYTDSKLGDASAAGQHTKMPIILSVMYPVPDVVESDTSTGLIHDGTRITRRTATLEYVDLQGITRTETIVGRKTEVVTQHTKAGITESRSVVTTLVDWYEDAPGAVGFRAPFIRDQSTQALGQVLNGVEQGGVIDDSEYGEPADQVPYIGYVPPFPAYSSTIVGTAAPLYLQYHNEIKPAYVKNTTLASTEMNNSALYGVTRIELSPIGCVTTESLGMFAHPDATSSAATRIELYGTAVYDFDWATGALTFNLWKPLLDVNGNEVASKIIDLPAGSTWGGLGTNCLITYRGLHWPDVKEYIKLRNTDMKSDTFAFTTPGFKTLVDAVKAG